MRSLPRRTFLGLGAAALAPSFARSAVPAPSLVRARGILRGGTLGRIVFCQVRAPRRQMPAWAGFARSAMSGPFQSVMDCAAGSTPAVKFHGEKGTLLVTEAACLIFHAPPQ